MQNSSKSILDPHLLSNLKSLELKARFVVEGFMVGLHKSPYHGFSAEFSEHRSYMQGDPLKDIDWKVYAKRDKFFVKRYEEETNLISNIFIDISKSMDYKEKGSFTKLEYASILAASLVQIMQQQQDATGLTFFSDDIINYFPPKANRVYARNLQQEIAKIKPSSKTEIAASLAKVAQNIKKKGLIIILSDFFDDVEEILKTIKNFRYKNNEVILFQILDPIELDFGFYKSAVFIDKETNEELITQPIQIRKAYKEAMDSFLHKLKTESINSGIEYNLLLTTTPFEKALISYFSKRKKLL